MLQFFFHCRYLLFILLPLVAIFTLLEIKSIKFCFPALKEHFVHQKRNEQILRKTIFNGRDSQYVTLWQEERE